MTQVTLKGNPVTLGGELVKAGDSLKGKGLVFTNKNLEDVSLDSFAGEVVVLNVFPSTDTGVCAFSVREFNSRANGKQGVKVLCVSGDLPFAQDRFCAAEGLENVLNLSSFRNQESLNKLGLLFVDGPLKGLSGRAVVVLDKDLNVTYVDLSSEVGEHVNYDAAMEAVNKLV